MLLLAWCAVFATVMRTAAADGSLEVTTSACGEADAKAKLSSATPTTATIAWDTGEKERFLEYYAGKFPTQAKTVAGEYTLEGLSPGETTEVKVWLGSSRGGGDEACVLRIVPPSVDEVRCELSQDVDIKGYDLTMPYAEGLDFAGTTAGSAEACCDACAALQPRPPYVQRCTRFTFEHDTGRCFFKEAGNDGNVEREGWTAGAVVLKR
mmetsp:Transcript_22382/g.72643  ORF Transcript_22382/g.72643 Transcript_22382/m.72643 type:complete len:209 (+) Transcript_22382:768-1394(+)